MSVKKHLALVISALSSGGAERVLSELANAWVEEGYKVSLITLASPDTKPFYPLSKKINLVQLDQSTDEKAKILERLRRIWKRIIALRKTFRHLNPNLILSFVDVMNITTLLAAKGLGIPVVVAERTNPKYYGLGSLYKGMRRLVYPWATEIIVQTQSAADYFSKRLNAKMTIIPNFVKPAEQIKSTAQIKKPVHKIVSVGRLNRFKGFQDLIHAFALLVSVYPNLELTIYGEGKERVNLESLIRSLGMQGKIHLPGAVKNVDAALYEADLFVFPSHYEGFPNALCEAMSVGLPIIASNCSGNIDIIEDKVNGRFFPVGDVETLAELMKKLIKDTDQRVQLSKEAAKISQHFSAQKVLGMWQSVMNTANCIRQEKD